MRPLLAAAALAAAVLPAAPAGAVGGCRAVWPARASCSYYASGGPVTLTCAALTCNASAGASARFCTSPCRGSWDVAPGTHLTLTVYAGAATLADG